MRSWLLALGVLVTGSACGGPQQTEAERIADLRNQYRAEHGDIPTPAPDPSRADAERIAELRDQYRAESEDNPLTEAPSARTLAAKTRQRARSDDAESLEEVFFHAEARATVIRHVEPNSLRVGGAEFRVKRNPAGRGAFVYDPRTEFSGVTRNLVWWVPEENAAYPLNSPSQLVTPGLEFPARAGLLDAPDTSDVVAYVF